MRANNEIVITIEGGYGRSVLASEIQAQLDSLNLNILADYKKMPSEAEAKNATAHESKLATLRKRNTRIIIRTSKKE